MPKIVIVETNGLIKELDCRDVSESGLYKVIKLKSSTGFSLKTTWSVTIEDVTFNIMLYGKTDGKAGQENKYDFPPPVDSALFFGKCVLVNRGGDLTLDEWNRVYEYLFGGFEDLNSEGEDEDDDDEYDDIPKTSTGYAKDGFVVDDETESEIASESESESESDPEDSDDSSNKKKKPKAKPKAKSKAKVKKAIIQKSIKNKATTVVDFTEELTPEDYV